MNSRTLLLTAVVGAIGGCALPPGYGGAIQGGLLTGGASARWYPPRPPPPDWKRWNDCLRAQHALRGGDACRCVVAFRALADLAEFSHCHGDTQAVVRPGPADGVSGDAPAEPPDLDVLKRRLRADEGWSDGSDGHVGYGHSLPLDLDSAEALLDVAARRALVDAAAVLDSPRTWAALTRDRRVALASMAYQMGRGGLRGFGRMLAAVRGGDYAAAADEMLDSRWARVDSPARARRMATLMRDG